jgi:pilus assembly protein CpaF
MIKLTITEKGGDPKALSFDKEEVSIGRVSGNDIVLPKGNVSKRHSKLSLRNGNVEIADLKSTNGTYVNGKKIAEPMKLSGSDRIYVGDFLITIDGLEPAAEASESQRLPPPPPPARGSAPLEITGTGGEDEEDAPLAAHPPRSSGRLPLPPPPPPPPRRQPTPLASQALDDEENDDGALARDLGPPSARELDRADDGPSNAGLFEKSAADDHAAFDGAGGRPQTSRRPGAAIPPEPSVPTANHESLAAAQAGLAGEAAGTEGLDALLADAAVTQILIPGPDATYVDRGEGLAPFAGSLGDPNAVADALWRIANAAVPPPPPENPVVDVRLPDGTRVAAVFPPASPRGVVAVVRKPGVPERALGDLCPAGARELQTLLEAAVATQRNLLCTGDAGALAALMSAIAGAIPSDRRAVSLGGGLGRARTGWTDLAPTPDMPALVRVAAALRAEHLLVAEPAGTEVLDLLVAAARGQEGLAVSLAARTPAEGLARMTALATLALGPAGAGAAPLVTSTIDLVAHVVTGPDGAARVVELCEPVGGNNGTAPGAQTVASWRSDGRRGGPSGRIEVDGVSARLGAAMEAAGTTLASGLVRKKG